ncbi:VOC family protein [Teichococcus aestuarii]|uniref:VOC family protein n=1 Tax=Teichococcus aestuarii TaxID=568898 RepID=UPI0036118B30
MLDYATLGTSDLARALRFYDALLAPLGHARRWTGEDGASWAVPGDPAAPFLYVGKPFDGGPATRGNGAMLAFRAPSTALVRELHRLALALGGTDEGAPGLRPRYAPDFYGAYARDPDGNKLAFVCRGPAALA